MRECVGACLQNTLFFHTIWHLLLFGGERRLLLTVKNRLFAPGEPIGDKALGALAVADADQNKRDDSAFVTVVTDGRIAVMADAAQGAVRCGPQRGGEPWSMGSM